MIYSVLSQDFSYENIKFKTVKKEGVILTVIDKGNGKGEVFSISSSDPKDYLKSEYTPGTEMKI